MNAPEFSIVIPTYSREREVCRAVESCLSQNFKDFEIVVVDDPLTDGGGLRNHALRVYELAWRVRVLSHLIRREHRAALLALAGYLKNVRLRPRPRALAGIGIAAISPNTFLPLRQMRARSL